MIPKNLFFIWLGDNKPDYVDYAINAFKEVNPDFQVDLIEYSVEEIENIESLQKSIYDVHVRNCVSYILKKSDKIFRHHVSQFYRGLRKFIQTIANMLRFEILNHYGGIYLDCDTYPVKPFDTFLLKNKSFCSYAFPSYDPEHRYRDNFFIGKERNEHPIYDCFGIFSTFNVGFYKPGKYHPEWEWRKKLFFDCKLKDRSENTESYIEHFVDRTWKTNRTPICKYDKMLTKVESK